MLDQLRDRMAAYLSHHRTCVLSTAGSQGAWAMPVRYRSQGMEVDCLVPRWTDVAYYVEQDPRVLLVIQDTEAPALRWLQVQGRAQPVAEPCWEGLLSGWTSSAAPDELYLVIRVTPARIELFDEGAGWGARETVEY